MLEELSIYFEPVADYLSGEEGRTRLSDITDINSKYFPEGDYQIAIIGVNEKRGGLSDSNADQAADRIRHYLYKLYAPDVNVKVADLGNIMPGETIRDTYFALQKCVSHLVKNNVVPVIIGGTQDLTYANYQGYESLEQTINVLAIDPMFDMGDVEGELNMESYLGKIVLHQPNYLFNFSNIGYQRYFVDKTILELMEGLYFDSIRLGEVRANMQLAEPAMRNADLISFDMSAIRRSDAPGAIGASPHGFYGEEACQLMRYAGISDKLTSIGLYNYDPSKDSSQTAHLMAQMLWHFIEGFGQRKNDFPIGSKEDYLRYLVTIKDHDEELVFLKSPKSDRWWMEIPYPPNDRIRFARHATVPCAYEDYQVAMKDELPDLWLRTYKKLG